MRCSKCGASITKGSSSGMCGSCSHVGSSRFHHKLGRKCSKCGKGISDTNMLGLCIKHKLASAWGDNEGHKKRREKKVRCHTPGCENEFELEWWQHPEMAWCKDCREGEDYKEYAGTLWVTVESPGVINWFGE